MRKAISHCVLIKDTDILKTMMEFQATIYKVGINPCIDIPLTVSATLQQKPGYIPIIGTINGYAITANLVPVKNSMYRLYMNLPMRKGANADVADTVTVTLSYDSSHQKIPMPKLLNAALKENPMAEKVWVSLPPSRKKEIKRYINSLKTVESVRKNVNKLIDKWKKLSE